VSNTQCRRFKVVLDSVHGAGGASAAMLLDKMGVELIHLYAEPTGCFPHPPEPTRDHLTELCKMVKKHGADIGFAQDPDADRLAVVDEKGRYIGEEYTLALSSLNVLRRSGRSSPSNVLVTNLSTSRMIDDIAASFNATVIRTPVGEANVAESIRTNHALIGGEGNGGVIWPKVIHVRDSLVGIALLLDLMSQLDKPLSGIIHDLPTYSIVKDKINIQSGLATRCIDRLVQHYSSHPHDLQDGIRIDWDDRWIHVRPSNTEPIIRLIAEATSEDLALQLISDAKQVIG